VRLAERAAGRRQRWREVAVQAARQSGRGDVPSIDGPLSLAAAVEGTAAEVRVVLAPDAREPLLDLVSSAASDALVAVLIGPEGGLGASELALADAHGFRRARLGPLVLRTEIAATAVLGALLARHDVRRL
jgi:16S rRNA (uracil1498-N3)-methyltransferase